MNKFSRLFLLITIFSVVLPGVTVAQLSVKHYMKDDGDKVRREGNADYIRIYQKEKRRDTYYNLTEYYPDQQVKRTGQVSEVEDLPAFHGKVTSYYKDGQVESEVEWVEGKPMGEARYFYPDGQLQKIMIHSGVSERDKFLVPDTLREYYDSVGKVLVMNRNGYVKYTHENGDWEEGAYQEGVKQGEWKGTFMEKKYSYIEQYERGKLVTGVSRDSTGKENVYKSLQVPPKYGDGDDDNGIKNFRLTVLGIFMANSGPAENGLTKIEFFIDEDGYPTSYKLLVSPNGKMGRAGVDAVRRAGRWTPGYERGVPVRVKYTIPFTVKTSR